MFNQSWCNRSFSDGIWLEHPLCTQNMSRFNVSNYNVSWCLQSYQNGAFKDHPFCHEIYNGYNVSLFNNSWCSEMYEYGIFIQHPLCKEVFEKYNMSNFNESWCSKSYEGGLFLRHPRCTVLLTTSTPYTVDQSEMNTMFERSIYMAVNFDKCGITLVSDKDYIMYNQTVVVVYGDNPSSIIYRTEVDYYNFQCKMNRTIYEKLEGDAYFNTSMEVLPGEQVNTQTSTFGFTFTHSNMSGNQQLAYEVGDDIRFQLHSNTNMRTVKAVIQECWTTTDGHNNKKYMLIDNRCVKDEGTHWISQNRTTSLFRVEAFRYFGESQDRIYMQCSIRMCLMDDYSSECQYCGNNAGRRRRDTDEETRAAAINNKQILYVKSPVFFILPSESSSSSIKPFYPDGINNNNNNSNNSGEDSFIFSGTKGTIIVILITVIVLTIMLFIAKKLFVNKAVSPAPSHLYVAAGGDESKGCTNEVFDLDRQVRKV